MGLDQNENRNNIRELEKLKLELMRVKTQKDYFHLAKIISQICKIRKEIGSNNEERMYCIERKIFAILHKNINKKINSSQMEIAIKEYDEELDNFINITKRAESSFPYKYPIIIMFLSLIIIGLAIYALKLEYSDFDE